jgi:hypothetical protein
LFPFPQNDDATNDDTIQQHIDSVIDSVRREITSTTLLKDLETRIDDHNRRAFAIRMPLIQQARVVQELDGRIVPNGLHNGVRMLDDIVGPRAARNVTLATFIRPASSEEREYAQNSLPSDTPPGLNVREDIGDDIFDLIAKVKTFSPSSYSVTELRHLVGTLKNRGLLCDLTLLSVVKRAVELGAFAVIPMT